MGKEMPGSHASLNIDVFRGVFERRNTEGCAERRREKALVWPVLACALMI